MLFRLKYEIMLKWKKFIKRKYEKYYGGVKNERSRNNKRNSKTKF